jgi:fatty-acyl-CoA synthase
MGLGLSPGDRILIARPTSWEWIDAWLGALLAGGVPIAAAPGANLGGGRGDIDRIEGLVETVNPRHVLLSQTLRSEMRSGGGSKAGEKTILFEELSVIAPTPGLPPPEPRETAFLQLTAGTGGRARAVEISDRAAIHNALALDAAIMEPIRAAGTGSIDAIVSWLPLHHDMGLVGAFLLAILTGRDLCLLPPSAFVAKPRLWLELIATRPGVLSLSPNFGFQLCMDRLKGHDAGGLDLSGWRAAICGAEMIHPATAAGFESTFSEQAFRPEAFRPGYGLAEATVAVTVDQKGRGVRTRPLAGSAARLPGTSEVVCVGGPVLDTEIRVAGPNGIGKPEDEAGEVWVRGPGLFTGYYGDPQATREALQDGWLRTGDLGFLHQGELYLTGRNKEVLIIRGRKIMPQELESLAEGVGSGSSRAAAFSFGVGVQGEQAVLVMETQERDADALTKSGHEIRDRIGKALGLPLADLVFVRRGRIPRTASGKIRRTAAKELYLAGRLQQRTHP